MARAGTLMNITSAGKSARYNLYLLVYMYIVSYMYMCMGKNGKVA